jgi:aminoglycoside phosphotransferase (APT) family kinase protein
MSMSRYLWTVAHDLRAYVHPALEGGIAQDTLTNAIRILTAVANALEAEPAPELAAPAPFAAELVDSDRLIGPADNPAVYRATGAAIAAIARGIDEGATSSTDAASGVAWEKALLDAAIARMDAAETATAPAVVDRDANIDPDALQAHLRAHTGAPDLTITAFRPILGGRSRQTALFSVTGAPGLPADLVVQRSLPGLVPGPAFVGEAGQYALLDALHAAGLKVPRPLVLETGAEALGAAFIVTDRSPGLPAQPDYWSKVEPEGVALDLARQMALLHAQPYAALQPKLAQSRERYDRAGWLEELEGFAARWHALAHWPSIAISTAIAWMREHVDCLDERRALVHNDMIFHNILAEDGRITAILDWEQTSVGHPGEDLGYAYPSVSMATDWNRFMAVYAEAGGPPVTQRQVDYFALRACLRMLLLVLQGGRDAFDTRGAEGVLVASAGAHWSQRFIHRFAGVVTDVLGRS